MKESIGLHPMGDRVLVARLKEKEITTGGIYIPEQNQEAPQFGRVLESGTELKRQKSLVDEIVLFGKYAGREVEFLDKKYLLLREEEIEGIITNPGLVGRLVEQGA